MVSRCSRVVVDDLAAATAFFVELGPKLQRRGPVRGGWVDRVVGPKGVRARSQNVGVRRRLSVAGRTRRGVKRRELEPAVAVRGLQHRDCYRAITLGFGGCTMATVVEQRATPSRAQVA